MNRVPLTFTVKVSTGSIDIECTEVVMYRCPFCKKDIARPKTYTKNTLGNHLKEYHQLDVQ